MIYKKIALMSVLAVVLVGCSREPSDYLKEAQTVPPIVVPPSVSMKPAQNYYPIPNASTGTVTQPPSQQPPGSDLQRFKPVKNQQQALARPTTAGTIQTAELPEAAETKPILQAKATESLIVTGSADKVWAKVGRALQKSPFQILDQDPSMDSFYVLDSASTGNKITKATPIYRVYLKPVGDKKTEIMLLDQQNQPAASDIATRVIAILRHKL